MTISTLDARTALVVIDLQNGIVALPAVHPVDRVVERAAALAAAFRRHRLPVVLVNVAGGAPGRTEQLRNPALPPPGWTDLVPGLDSHASDHRVTKRCWSALSGTGLQPHLKALGVSQLVLAGIATSIGVESTARQAYDAGFNVTLAIDAMTDLDVDAHINSVTRIFPRLGETGAAQEVIGLLDTPRA